MFALSLNFFPGAPTIGEQLKAQGFAFKKKKAISFEKVKNSINTLMSEGFVTPEEGFEMATKLANQVNVYAQSRGLRQNCR